MTTNSVGLMPSHWSWFSKAQAAGYRESINFWCRRPHWSGPLPMSALGWPFHFPSRNSFMDDPCDGWGSRVPKSPNPHYTLPHTNWSKWWPNATKL